MFNNTTELIFPCFLTLIFFSFDYCLFLFFGNNIFLILHMPKNQELLKNKEGSKSVCVIISAFICCKQRQKKKLKAKNNHDKKFKI